MTRDALDNYLGSLNARLPLDRYVERRFTAVSQTGGIPDETSFHYRGLMREREPKLADVLTHSRSLVLAEPGGGKSVVGRAAVHHFAQNLERVPVFIELKEYRGDLSALLTKGAPPELLDANATVAGKRPLRAYVLDGFDEIPANFLERLSPELQNLLASDPDASALVTSRQAFYVAHRDALPGITSLFYILDLSDKDIAQYARKSGIEDPRAFIEAVQAVDAMEEVRNPFVLFVVIEKFRAEGALSDRRSKNLSYMIDRLTQSRPRSQYEQRRALQMLAVAMETYARNELTEDEALRVIKEARKLSDEDASSLLDELYASILRRTANGLAFQLRSYGEYLAAEALADDHLDRIKELAFLDYITPNDSWLNAISYLVELNPEVRRFFVRHFPLWAVSSSPAVFSPEQRDEIVTNILQICVREHHFIVHHPLINARRLSRFITEQMERRLFEDLRHDDPIVRGNALVLLGVREHREVVPHALQVATDKTLSPTVRYCGIVALVNAGSHEEVPELLQALDPADQIHMNMLDMMGALINEEQIPTVLPLILRERAMLSSTFYHWREFRSREALTQVLRYFLEHPHDLNDIHAESYIEPIIELLPEFLDAELAELCVDVLEVIASQHIYPDQSGPLPKLFAAMREADHEGTIARIFLERALQKEKLPGRHLYYVYQVIVPLMSRDTARWLIDAHATELIKEVAPYSNGEIREMLRPHSEGILDAQEANARAYREQEAKDKESREQHIATVQQRLLGQTSFDEALTDLWELKEDYWPDLPETHCQWLASEISKRLASLDLEHTIEWKDNILWQPGILGFHLKLLDRYALKIDPDEPLVFVLTGWDNGIVARYHKRFSLSTAAQHTFLSLLRNPPSPRALEELVRFLESTDIWSADIADVLTGIASSGVDLGYMQVMTLALLGKHGIETDFVAKIANLGASSNLRRNAFESLVAQQHRATIERALASLTDDDLRAGNVGIPDSSPLDWIAKVRSDFAWQKLEVLRGRALQLELPSLVGIISNALANIDRARTAKLIRKQIGLAPQSWRVAQMSQAIEQERTARIEAAQSAPFDTVLARLKGATSISVLKVLCEGPSDLPVFRSLIAQFDGVPEVIFDSIGGWPNLRSKPDPNLWLLGCKEAVIVMDGDNGRDFTKATKPHTDIAKQEIAKVAGLPIEMRVLERYGIENYFPQRILEKLTGKNLTAFFPIPHGVSVPAHLSENGKPFYSKGSNEQAASMLSLQDVEGTDLVDIVRLIAKKALELSE